MDRVRKARIGKTMHSPKKPSFLFTHHIPKYTFDFQPVATIIEKILNCRRIGRIPQISVL